MLPYGLHFTSITWSTEKKSEVGTKEKENELIERVEYITQNATSMVKYKGSVKDKKYTL